MQKFARLSLGLALVAAVGVAFTNAVAAPSTKSGGFKVVSGAVQATVNGVTKTYGKGDTIPDQAVVTATSDAQLSESGGMTIRVKAGSSYQAAHTADGSVDVKATGGSVSVSGGGQTYSLPVGGEISASPDAVQVISGTIVYKGTHGSFGMSPGDSLSNLQGTAIGGTSNTATILVPPAPPAQQQTVVNANPVTPSAP